jgi:hypothetical protein
MIPTALLAISLIVPASIDRSAPLPLVSQPPAAMSIQQKRAVVRPLVSTATECIARTVSADPRFPTLAKAGGVNDLIVDSMSTCLDAVRSMIDAYDRLFGEGSGETFFMGPYLDGLPTEVDRFVNGKH